MTLLGELRQTIAELDLVSEVPAVELGRSSKSADPSREPYGGVDREGDKEAEWVMKSADYFRRKLSRAQTQEQLEGLLKAARASLRASRRQAEPQGLEPEKWTLAWRRMIANSDLPIEKLAATHCIGRRTVARYRSLYREAA